MKSIHEKVIDKFQAFEEICEIIVEDKPQETYWLTIKSNQMKTLKQKVLILYFNQKEDLNNLVSIINHNKNIFKKNSSRSKKNNHVESGDSDKVEFVRTCDKAISKENDPSSVYKKENIYEESKSKSCRIGPEDLKFNISLGNKSQFLSSGNPEQKVNNHIKSRFSSKYSRQSASVSRALSVINETNECTFIMNSESRTIEQETLSGPEKTIKSSPRQFLSSFQYSENSNTQEEFSFYIKKGNEQPETRISSPIFLHHNQNFENNLTNDQRIVQVNVFNCCLTDSSVLSPYFGEEPKDQPEKNSSRKNELRNKNRSPLSEGDTDNLHTNNTQSLSL